MSAREDLLRGHDHGLGYDFIERIAATSTKLEDRLGVSPEFCEAPEFHDIYSMATEHGNAVFAPSSPSATTQSCSRSQNLPELLESLYLASSARDSETEDSWAWGESDQFRQQMLMLATKILVDEVSQLERVRGDRVPYAALPIAERSHSGVRSGHTSTVDIEPTEKDPQLLEETVSPQRLKG